MQSKDELNRQANEFLRRSNYDAVTGEKKDKRYLRKQKASIRRAQKEIRYRERKMGKLGPASDVKIIKPEEWK